MLYRRFGRTGLQMPVLTCGGMRYQHKWQDVPPEEIPAANQENLEKTIHRAYELGINHIETARGYGSSEMQLGRVLPLLPREKIIVQTKVGPNTDPKEFIATFKKSMDYLRLDHVDLFSIHGINNAETLNQTLRKGGCMEAARGFQREGRVRFIGFSTHGPTDIIRQAINSGEFDYVNLHWYFVNDANWSAIQDARKLDMGIFIISPNDKGGLLYKPSDKLSRLCQPLSPMVFNDLYCLKRPEVHTLSIGASKPTDFDEHIRALELLDRADELVPPVEKRLRSELDQVLGCDWMENWDKNIPGFESTPGQINIWEILRLWNFAKALDMVDFGKMRYNLLGSGNHWFPGQNASTVRDHDIRSLLKGHPLGDRIPGVLEEAHKLLFEAPVKRLSESD